ncbi:MAG: 1-deoxy-D-xylulose-5-phosphate synthase [Candidatus Neomarinimicrobiota bacterium]|nr:MAG: 1-deoxy-D-xylulose-5-phosphate synthase [Candidatus Neomarinimicrobiota bacterium]
MTEYRFLPHIHSPADLRVLSPEDLHQVVDELRDYIIDTVTEIGGHLASTLGVIELTVALHTVYNTPRDKLVWDTGHQGYAHKILTGRFEEFRTIRRYKGLSGFLKRSESEYDVFGAGHASTSISAALGLAVARDLKGEDYKVVAVIGDGAMTGGLAYEGLNNAGSLRKQMLVILNDNNMSISPNVGAMRTALTRMVTNPLYNRVRDEIWAWTRTLPFGKDLTRMMFRKAEESLKNLVVPGIVFDEMGFRYFGPVDGHDLDTLLKTLRNIYAIKTPVLLHIVTRKGKGLKDAEEDPVGFHGIKGKPRGTPVASSGYSFTQVFGHLLCEVAQKRQDVIGITPAMREGSGMVEFARRFPDRFFDVGIAEGHAVTFSAGLAANQVRPVCAVYSTFMQRAFDHLVHDSVLQHLPVVYCLDRAGVVGEDGPTHHGTLDIAYMRCIPDMIVTAPRDGNEFRNLLYTGLNQSATSFSIRYPKGAAGPFDPDGQAELLPIGSWEVLRPGTDVAILAVGPLVLTALEVAEAMAGKGLSCEVVNCRFIKPMDLAYLKRAAKKFAGFLTVEEGVLNGGFGEGVLAWLHDQSYPGVVLRSGLPDQFIEHGPRSQLLQDVGLDGKGIRKQVQKLAKRTGLPAKKE